MAALTEVEDGSYETIRTGRDSTPVEADGDADGDAREVDGDARLVEYSVSSCSSSSIPSRSFKLAMSPPAVWCACICGIADSERASTELAPDI